MGEFKKLFEPVIKTEEIVFESGRKICRISRDSTATALLRMAYK